MRYTIGLSILIEIGFVNREEGTQEGNVIDRLEGGHAVEIIIMIFMGEVGKDIFKGIVFIMTQENLGSGGVVAR